MDRFLDLDSLLELRFLKLDAYPVLKLVDVAKWVEAEYGYGSAIGSSKAFDTLEGCGLAGTVRADETEYLAIVDFE